MNFLEFKQLFQSNFSNFIKEVNYLYITDLNKDLIWNTYINSFDEDIRQEFNCNSCKQFIRNYGNLVKINSNYQLVTYWDFEINNKQYQQVINNLKTLVLNSSIKDVFLNETNKLGIDSNWDINKAIKWNHLYYQLPNNYKTNRNLIESKKSEYRDNKSVFKRSLNELTGYSVDTVLDLIEQNNLYKGLEFKQLLLEFNKHQNKYSKLPDNVKDNYCWLNAVNSNAINRIRNTSIGTLLIDLSNEVDLETAIRKYEKVVAPTNYKRPQPLITQKMVEDAQKTIEALGLSEALHRRFANQDDLELDNVLFVNRSNKEQDILNLLKKDVIVNAKKLKPKEVSLDEFVTKLLPNSSLLEILVENKHESNLVSLLTSDSNTNLFKWSNNFSWCYTKGLTDSLKGKVKSAGGKVDGKLRVSLEWYNYDDLDLHIQEPNYHIYYGNKVSKTGGNLNVDMQAGGGTTRTPVENIIYPHNSKLPDGIYKIYVNQFNKRETTNTGFKVEIEYNGEILIFEHDSPRQNKSIDITTFEVTNGEIKFKEQGKLNTKSIWNLKTNLFHKVLCITFSPNYWNNNTGNKHIFFFIEDCKNNEVVRGIFNEYLKDELLVHKKVFEALGARLNIEYTDNQLSGLGFSTTLKKEFVVKVDNQVIKVIV